MSRVDLDPVEEARAMARLIDSGLTRRGVAQKLSLPQARVRERLGLLELGEGLLPKVADGTIPLAAVKALVELAKVHPELPARAVARVLEGEASEDPYGEQWTWKDVQHNALEVAIAGEDELPVGVYLAYRSYALECFTLSDKARATSSSSRSSAASRSRRSRRCASRAPCSSRRARSARRMTSGAAWAR